MNERGSTVENSQELTIVTQPGPDELRGDSVGKLVSRTLSVGDLRDRYHAADTLGKRGDVARIVDDSHVIVNGVNTVKRHTKPNPMKNQPGGIVTKEVPIHVSNVAIWNPVTQKPDRIGFKLMEDGRKLRFYKSNGEQING